MKELTEKNLRLKSEITALNSHSIQSIPFTQSQSQGRLYTEQEQLPFVVTRSPQVLANTTCASSLSNLKEHNVELVLVGQRSSPATLPDSSDPGVEHTLTGQRFSLATGPTLLDSSGQDIELSPVIRVPLWLLHSVLTSLETFKLSHQSHCNQ